MDYIPQKITFGDKVTGNAKFIERRNMLAEDTDKKLKDWQSKRLANAARRKMMAENKRSKGSPVVMNAMSQDMGS